MLEGAEVLSDSLRLTFRKAKPEFITVFFERHEVIRFDDRAAIARYGTLTLPESFDPGYDQQDLPLAERGRIPRPLYFNTTVDHFAARVIAPAESVRELVPQGKVVRQKVAWGTRYHEAWSYAIELPGIMPGEVVELHYKYVVPFQLNWQRFNAMRLFFEGPLRKRSFHLRMEASEQQGFEHWGNAPDSTRIDNGMIRSFWTRHDLPALADEVNARQHRELRHLVIGPQPFSGLYMHAMRSGQAFDIPYWAAAMRLRESQAMWWRRVAQKRVPDAQTNRMKVFLAAHPDPSPARQASHVHNAIANDFNFEEDAAWYNNDDKGLARMGDQMRDQRLRRISRYDLYSKYLSMLRLKYWTVYVADKRVGDISPDWLSPVFDNEWLFLLNDSGSATTMHPKQRRFGLLANELPFYWEGTRGIVGDVDKLWRDEEMAPELGVTPELIPIAQLRPELNQRGTDAALKIDLATRRMELEARISLSGQYSTLCRGAWLYQEVDSTIDPRCAWPLSEARGVKDPKVSMDEVQNVPPFRFHVHVEADVEGRVTIMADSTWRIDLGGLLSHVAPRDFHSEGRDLAFWFDFLGGDLYTFTLSFDRPVQLLHDQCNWPETQRHPFASLVSSVRQLDATTIEVSRVFTVKQERVEVKDAKALDELLNAAANERFTLVVGLPGAEP